MAFEITIRGEGASPPALGHQIRAVGLTPGLKLRLTASFPALDSLQAQAEARFRQARETGDDDALIKHFRVWLSLHCLKTGQPWPIGV